MLTSKKQLLNIVRNIFIFIIILLFSFSFSFTEISAQNEDNYNEGSYELLAPLPGFGENVNFEGEDCALGKYLELVLNILLGVIAVIAMIMMVIGGLQYVTSELISNKEDGKKKIQNALLGLLIALTAWLILNTVNPNLLNLCLNQIPTARIEINEPEFGIGTGKEGEQITIKDENGEDASITACDESQMSNVTVFGTTVKTYKGLIPGLERMNQKWLQKPPSERYKVNSMGGYNCRVVAGKNKWSSHAFGTAFDINPVENPYGKEKIYDMPQWFIDLFKEEGYGWGGDWNNIKDTMHFSKFPPIEGGNGKVGP